MLAQPRACEEGLHRDGAGAGTAPPALAVLAPCVARADGGGGGTQPGERSGEGTRAGGRPGEGSGEGLAVRVLRWRAYVGPRTGTRRPARRFPGGRGRQAADGQYIVTRTRKQFTSHAMLESGYSKDSLEILSTAKCIV